MSSVLLKPNAVSQIARGSSISWTSLSANAGTDTLTAVVDLTSNAWSYRLFGSTLGAAIPTGDLIYGMKAEVYVSSANIAVSPEFALSLDGTTLATATKTGVYASGAITVTWISAGGSVDKWGITPTYTDLNSNDFSIVFAARAPLSGGHFEVGKMHLTVWHGPVGGDQTESSFMLNFS